MNAIWLGITPMLDSCVPKISSAILAQAAPLPNPIPALPIAQIGNVQAYANNMAPFVLNIVAAIAILVIGWIIAAIASAIVGSLLKRTDIDNRLAAWITGNTEGTNIDVEKWAATAVFWLIMILVLVAFLERLQLTVVSQPLTNFLNQILVFLPKLGGAAILLGVAWVLATIVKLIVTRGLRAFRLDERLGQQVGTVPAQNQLVLSETLANALYWFIFLLFLPAILSTLELQGTLQPVQQLLNQILSILPNILAAILIGAAGWLVAQVVRRIVTNLLAATGTDRLGTRFGLSRTPGGQSLSWLIGTIVYVLILIPTAIAALNALRIEAISAPAIAMLTQILNAIPQIVTAGLILFIAYFLGQFVSDLVTNILTSFGFNNIFYWLGIQSRPSVFNQTVTAPPPASEATTSDFTEPAPPTPLVTEVRIGSEPTRIQSPTTIQPPDTLTIPTRTPSEIVGIIVLIGIMLFAAVAAIDILKIEALTRLVTGIVAVSGQILGGLIVFAIGLYLANLAFNLITSSGNRQARILAQTARIAIIALVSAMALQQMGIASNIVNLAFGLLLGAIAVAIALAFGLGSRDIAAEQVREWLASFKDSSK